MIIPGGRWCDVASDPDGRVADVVATNDTLEVAGLSIDVSRFAPPWGFARVALNRRGVPLVIGQAADGRALYWIQGIGFGDQLGDTHGVYPVEVRGAEDGWEIFVLRPGYYERILLNAAGAPTRASRVDTPTSQGFLSADFGPLLQDEGRFYAPFGHVVLLLPESLDGSVWVGQHPEDPPRLRAARVVNGVLQTATLIQVNGFGAPPHLARGRGGELYVCSWVPQGAWFERYASADAMPWGNEVQAPPPPLPPPVVNPPPVVEPPKKEPPVSIPNRFHLVQATSDAHPQLLALNTRESMTELLWRVALALHAEDANWGLVSKSAGENHVVIGGQRVAVDALTYGASPEIVDIFRAAHDGPGTGALSWSIDERRPSNVRVTPPPMPGQPPPVVVPPTEPPPVTPPPPASSDVLARLAAIETKQDQILALLAKPLKLEARF